MPIGLVGRKCGMTRIFTEDGASLPVTVIAVENNRVTQIKTKEKDGYRAIQVTNGRQRSSKVNKAMGAHFAKAGVEAGRGLREFVITDADSSEGGFEIGHEFKVDHFQVGQKVDVVGVSKGKGFAGTIKRHNFRSQDATHGNSLSHRAPGSVGMNQSPGRVFKGKKMAGQMGNVQRTVQNQEVARIDLERNLILIKGVVPGAPGGDVLVLPSVKRKKGAK
jgi:large subunit ribosomal protein L3